MKPKEYIQKYFEKGEKLNREEFAKDLKTDFIAELTTMKGKNEGLTEASFFVVVKSIRNKWDVVFSMTKFDKEASDKFWKYFYAAIVMKEKANWVVSAS
jgi:hypothetical protein